MIRRWTPIKASLSIQSWSPGKWGFLILTVAIVVVAFRPNYRSDKMYETLRLNEDSLRIERIGPGRVHGSWQFQTYWLRVGLDDLPEQVSQLTPASHETRLVIGKFLSLQERLKVACALRGALDRLKQPPQAPIAEVG